MGGAFDDLHDDLDAAINAPLAEAKAVPANYKAPTFDEPCPKCRGTGRFVGYSGRSLGECFTCKGTGKQTFKTSREDRAASRTQSRARAASKVEAFQAEHPAIWAWMQGNDFPFAVAMVEALTKYGSLTDGQIAACQRCVDGLARASAARVEREATAPSVSISKIEEAFAAAAGSGLKRPKLRLDAFVFSPAKAASKWAGSIYVKDQGDYLGRVTAGKFVCTASCGAERQERILAAIANPESAATAYGRMTGACSCCGRPLTNKESVDRGIGPVCAEKYGW